MNKKLFSFIGLAVFWLTWPALWLMLRWSRRTRLLLICGDEFLVLRGWLGNGEWGLPGGGLHRGEDKVKGLIREVAEETGLTLKPHQVKFAFNGLYKGQGFRFNFYSFIAELQSKPTLVPQPREIAEIAWQNLNDPKIRLNSDARQTLEWWLNNR